MSNRESVLKIFRALYAFYRHLFTTECSHERLEQSATGNSSKLLSSRCTFCPDCGYKVNILWTMIRCRSCTSKRHPLKELDGAIKPMFKYCQQCGGVDFQIIKRSKIHAHEMPYAICTKEVDYSEQTPYESVRQYYQYANGSYSGNTSKNPFEQAFKTHVVEGEVLRREIVK